MSLFDTSTWKNPSDNHKELIRGSVLDPLNHPSYSEEKVAQLKADREAHAKELAELNAKYGM